MVRALKLVCSLAFIFIVATLLLIYRNSPATGYEISIYSSLPPAVWILLISAIAMGMGIIVIEAFTQKIGNLWLLGFLVLFLANFTFLSLTNFRGYYAYTTSDALAHLRMASEIASTGHFDVENYYPITHIIGGVLIQVIGVAPPIVVNYLPVIFTVMFMFSVYLLATVVGFARGQVLLAAAAGSILIFSFFHIATYPQALSLMAFPLAFFILFKVFSTPSPAHKILLIILLFLFPYFHLATEVVIVLCLLAGEAGKVLWRLRQNEDPAPALSAVGWLNPKPALITFAAFFMWFSSFALFDTVVGKFFLWIKGNIALIPRTWELLPVAKLEPGERIALFFKMYGAQFILLLLTIIAIVMAFRHFRQRQKASANLFILAVVLLIGGLGYMLIFLAAGLTTIGRLLGANSIMWALPVMAGLALYQLFSRPRIPRVVAIGAVIAILLFSSILGIFGVYRSPWILQGGWQVTYQDRAGLVWYGNHANPDAAYAPLGFPWPYEFYWIEIPPHFGYEVYPTLGEAILYIPAIEKLHPTTRERYYSQGANIILAQRFKVMAADPTLRQKGMVMTPEIARPGFDEQDFPKLEQDPSVARLYSNGGFEVLIVRAPELDVVR